MLSTYLLSQALCGLLLGVCFARRNHLRGPALAAVTAAAIQLGLLALLHMTELRAVYRAQSFEPFGELAEYGSGLVLGAALAFGIALLIARKEPKVRVSRAAASALTSTLAILGFLLWSSVILA